MCRAIHQINAIDDTESHALTTLEELGPFSSLKALLNQDSTLSIRTLEMDCDEFSSREQIVDAIRAHGALDARTILRVRLLGAVDPRMDLSISELEARLADETLQIFFEDRTTPAIDYASIAEENTLRGRFARSMNSRVEKASGRDRMVLERARLYGFQALLGREVRLK